MSYRYNASVRQGEVESSLWRGDIINGDGVNVARTFVVPGLARRKSTGAWSEWCSSKFRSQVVQSVEQSEARKQELGLTCLRFAKRKTLPASRHRELAYPITNRDIGSNQSSFPRDYPNIPNISS